MSLRASVFIGWWCVVGLLGGCSEPESKPWGYVPPVAGASEGSGRTGGMGATGGAGGGGDATIDTPPTGGAGSGGSGGMANGGAGGMPVAGQPALFDQLVGTDAARNDVPGDQVCDRIATIQCASEASCCAAPGRTFEDCKAIMKKGCEDVFLDQIMANPIANYDRARATQVFTEYERLSRLCDVNVATWVASNAGFRAFTRGTLAGGAECLPPAKALISPGAEAAAFLFACTNPDTQACLPTRDDWLCLARGTEGSACFIDTNCIDGLFCTNTEAQEIGGGTCHARKPENAPCSFGAECASFVCKAAACAPLTQQTIYCLQ
jgi:hypothetical protein